MYYLFVGGLVLLTLAIITIYICVATNQLPGWFLWITGSLLLLMAGIYGTAYGSFSDGNLRYMAAYVVIATYNFILGVSTEFTDTTQNIIMSSICAFLTLIASGFMFKNLHDLNEKGEFEIFDTEPLLSKEYQPSNIQVVEF